MRNFVPCLRSGLMARVAVVALISGATAACSADTDRFNESPFSNPFSTASSAPPAPRHERRADYQAAPTTRIQRAPLSAPSTAQARPMYGYGSQSASNGSYRAAAVNRTEPATTGSLSPARGAISRPAPSPIVASSGSNWSAEGGSSVTMQRGESIHSLSQRYGVPASAIMQANGLSNANGVGEGSRIVIPVYSAGGYAQAAPIQAAPVQAPAPRPAAPVYQPAPVVAQAAPMRPAPMAAPVPARPQVAAAAPVAPQGKMQFVTGPQGRGAEAAAKPAEPVRAAEPVRTAEPAKPLSLPGKPVVAAAKPAPALKPSVGAQPSEQAFAAKPAAPVVAPAPKAAKTEADDSVKTAALKVDPAPAAEPAGPSFRWPARGRVISAYGSKSSGASNDGVNISVPEGTDIKASDDGVVAYSGSELKGFGNLVLIRHSNGWVTAYAHNSALNVKRGDTVRRGQIIAKSGATGNVNSPQLHFEVRKGAQTVDPLKHLPDV